jgi:hypothetical protein
MLWVEPSSYGSGKCFYLSNYINRIFGPTPFVVVGNVCNFADFY